MKFVDAFQDIELPRMATYTLAEGVRLHANVNEYFSSLVWEFGEWTLTFLPYSLFVWNKSTKKRDRLVLSWRNRLLEGLTLRIENPNFLHELYSSEGVRQFRGNLGRPAKLNWKRFKHASFAIADLPKETFEKLSELTSKYLLMMGQEFDFDFEYDVLHGNDPVDEY